MPDDEPGDSVEQHPVEQRSSSAPVDPPPSPDCPSVRRAQSLPEQSTATEIHGLENRISGAEKWMIWLTGGIVLLTAGIVIVGILQWNAISGQLTEMKSGGKDTHDLAVAAGKQATKTETLATETHSLAVAANASAKAAKDANDIARTASQSVQRAFIVVDHLEILAERAPSGSVLRWIVNPVVTNSGNTPTVNLYFQIGFGGRDINWPVDREPPFDPPDFPSLAEIRSHRTNWQRGVVAAHANVTNFTVLNGFTAEGLRGPGLWSNTGEFTWGTFVYGDVFDNRPRHITEFCFVMNRTTMVNDQFAPYGRCNHHNCADQECEAAN